MMLNSYLSRLPKPFLKKTKRSLIIKSETTTAALDNNKNNSFATSTTTRKSFDNAVRLMPKSERGTYTFKIRRKNLYLFRFGTKKQKLSSDRNQIALKP